MRRTISMLMFLGLLASCGAAGAPVPPKPAAASAPPATGITITGSASAGIAKNGS